jgi:hypothetical protein
MPRDMAQPPKRPQVNDAFDSVADAKNTIKFYYSVAYPNQKIKVFKSNAAKFIRVCCGLGRKQCDMLFTANIAKTGANVTKFVVNQQHGQGD